MSDESRNSAGTKRFSLIRWTEIGIASLLLAYFCAYEYAGEKLYGFGAPGKLISYRFEPPEQVNSMLRKFKWPLSPTVFVPAAWLEAKVLRRQVVLAKTYKQNGYETSESAYTLNP